MRCRSWRPIPTSGHDHAPGSCRVCWGICWSKVDEGVRCDTCLWALAQHPLSSVRRLLIAEGGLSVEVLELLVTDPDSDVSGSAQRLLDETYDETDDRPDGEGVGRGDASAASSVPVPGVSDESDDFDLFDVFTDGAAAT